MPRVSYGVLRERFTQQLEAQGYTKVDVAQFHASAGRVYYETVHPGDITLNACHDSTLKGKYEGANPGLVIHISERGVSVASTAIQQIASQGIRGGAEIRFGASKDVAADDMGRVNRRIRAIAQRGEPAAVLS